MKNPSYCFITSFYGFLLDCIVCVTCLDLDDCIERTPPMCCVDYYEDGNLCKPCIGSSGNNCSKGVCSSGYFGHGCSEKCPCGTVLCDPEHGCPEGYGHEVHHYWLFIILGVLVLNSIPVVIAISGFIANRQRSEPYKDTEQNAKTSGENGFHGIKWPHVSLNTFSRCCKRSSPDDSDVHAAKQGLRKRNTKHDTTEIRESVFQRIKWPNVSLNGFLRCLKRSSSDGSCVDDVEQDLSRLEKPNRSRVLNLYVDAQKKQRTREQATDTVATASAKDDYFVMRMSMAPPKETIHHFTGREEEEEEEEEGSTENDKEVVYVEMNLQ